jgi:hypothetical protein
MRAYMTVHAAAGQLRAIKAFCHLRRNQRTTGAFTLCFAVLVKRACGRERGHQILVDLYRFRAMLVLRSINYIASYALDASLKCRFY